MKKEIGLLVTRFSKYLGLFRPSCRNDMNIFVAEGNGSYGVPAAGRKR